MSKKLTIFNKGKRSFHLEDGVSLHAGGTAKVAKELGEKLMKTYPSEVVAPSAGVVHEDTSALKAELAKCEDKLAKLEAKLAKCEAELEEATKPAEQEKSQEATK